MNLNVTCDKCQYGQLSDESAASGGKLYTCHESAPSTNIVLMPVQDSLGRQGLNPQPFSAWPLVKSTDWCGKGRIALAGLQ